MTPHFQIKFFKGVLRVIMENQVINIDVIGWELGDGKIMWIEKDQVYGNKMIIGGQESVQSILAQMTYMEEIKKYIKEGIPENPF